MVQRDQLVRTARDPRAADPLAASVRLQGLHRLTGLTEQGAQGVEDRQLGQPGLRGLLRGQAVGPRAQPRLCLRYQALPVQRARAVAECPALLETVPAVAGRGQRGVG